MAEYAAMLQRPLAALPGGGLRHGSIVTVQDQTQHFNVDLLIVHEDKVDAEAHPEVRAAGGGRGWGGGIGGDGGLCVPLMGPPVLRARAAAHKPSEGLRACLPRSEPQDPVAWIHE